MLKNYPRNSSTKEKNILKVKLATIVVGDPKAPFSIATTPRCRGGSYFLFLDHSTLPMILTL